MLDEAGGCRMFMVPLLLIISWSSSSFGLFELEVGVGSWIWWETEGEESREGSGRGETSFLLELL